MKKQAINFTIATISGIVFFSYANPFFMGIRSKTVKELTKTFKEKRGADLIRKGRNIFIKSRVGKEFIERLKKSKSINMPKVKNKRKSSTKKGYLRDKNFFWNKFFKKYPEALSEKNRQRIKNGKSPIVDRQWIKVFPEHKWNIGEKLEHHHLNHGSKAIPLPKTLHRGSGNSKILHQHKTVK